MKNVLIGACTFTVVMGVFSAMSSDDSDKVHWGYSGEEGPQEWATLDESFGTCASGRSQSPIDIRRVVKGDLPALETQYAASGTQVLNNGHTIQVNFAPGNLLNVADRSFELKQFHFHAPSENTIQGVSFPMEAHFVHADTEGNLAVVAVMFKEGKANAELEKAWSLMPSKAGTKVAMQQAINGEWLMPESREYYRFSGSLTTPPCSEGVNWFVLKQPVEASADQIGRFTKIMGEDNNRPVQPLHARVVVE